MTIKVLLFLKITKYYSLHKQLKRITSILLMETRASAALDIARG